MKNKNLILEIERIGNLMGINIISEAVGTELLELTLRVLNNYNKNMFISDAAKNAFKSFKDKVNLAKNTGRKLEFSRIVDDIYEMSKEQKDFTWKFTDWIFGGQPRLSQTKNDWLSKNLEILKKESDLDLRDIINVTVDNWYQGQLVGDSYKNLIKDRLFLDVKRDIKFPKSKVLSVDVQSLLSKIPGRELSILSNMYLRKAQKLSSMQRDLADLSLKAADKAQRGKSIQSELIDMQSILASMKNFSDDEVSKIYENWKTQLSNDPLSRVDEGVLKELDTYVETGKGAEIWKALSTDKTTEFGKWYETKFSKLWPFKLPSNPNGWWIFSNKLITKEWWERFFLFILSKNSRTIKELAGFLAERGLAKGTAILVMQRFITTHIFMPAVITVMEALGQAVEYVANVDWIQNLLWNYEDIDIVEWQGTLGNQLIGNIYLAALAAGLKDPSISTFIDEQELSTEFYRNFLVPMTTFMWQGGKNLGDWLGSVEQPPLPDDIPPDVKEVIESGQIPETGQSNKEEKKSENKKKIIPIGG